MTIVLSLKDLWPICCRKSTPAEDEALPNDGRRHSRGILQSQISQTSSVRILDHMTPSGDCCFNIFKRCCIASKQIEFFNDVGKKYNNKCIYEFFLCEKFVLFFYHKTGDFIHKLFEDDAFVPTDVAAGM